MDMGEEETAVLLIPGAHSALVPLSPSRSDVTRNLCPAGSTPRLTTGPAQLHTRKNMQRADPGDAAIDLRPLKQPPAVTAGPLPLPIHLTTRIDEPLRAAE